MITAICMNPTFDKTVEVAAFQAGGVNRILRSRTDVGGKGVNVAVVVQRLGHEARLIGCAGRDGVDKVAAALEAEGVEHHLLPVHGSVRCNTKIMSLDGSGVTELNENGPMMTAEGLAEFFAMARERAAGSDYVVISGSLPPGCPSGTYRELIRMLHGIPCVLDVGGSELMLGVEAKPFLIKPNHHELADALRTELHTMEDIRRAAMTFIEDGVEHVVVSMGKDGALYVGSEGCFHAPEIPVEVRSTVGAGDSMVAGLLCGLVRTGSMREALRYGAAAGTASVMTDGTKLIVPADFRRLLDKVYIQDV